ncbi:hypothetical protein BVRB_6g156180 [Beta vulgaris subsp. vulgaris]|uniref:Uncharacterized protein n=1 Tax=Beta vulgaris subsp. vulgaris TaxID=3555 RepID=A0A0J8B8L4_BETVV|nr:hypothetical protein BVRB_6g156180 [Beta vulgaris subsp. vulgaris]
MQQRLSLNFILTITPSNISSALLASLSLSSSSSSISLSLPLFLSSSSSPIPTFLALSLSHSRHYRKSLSLSPEFRKNNFQAHRNNKRRPLTLVGTANEDLPLSPAKGD